MKIKINLFKTLCIVVCSLQLSCSDAEKITDESQENIVLRKVEAVHHFSSLPFRWDEAVPLGNGLLGGLVWKKEGKLRMAIDRIDLWDHRIVEEVHAPEHTYKNIYEKWKNGNYEEVRAFRDTLRKYPYPSKIPGGAIEFNVDAFGEERQVDLLMGYGLCKVEWESGATLTTFVHANKPQGWIRFQNTDASLIPELIAPDYAGELNEEKGDDKGGLELKYLGYPKPEIKREGNSILYFQKTALNHSYSIALCWQHDKEKNLTAVWSIQTNENELSDADLLVQLKEAVASDYQHELAEHERAWEMYWGKSMVEVPDSVVQSQWIHDMYKFGCVTGISNTPISLQAIWTADNGYMPPWAGDFHHDLNTQMSYWPAYTSNHIQEAEIFTDWLWRTKDEAEKYANKFFGTGGIAYPGVTDIKGRLMPSWWQYAHSVSTPGWLAQSFYWQWRYTMDQEFLRKRAYPWLSGVADFFQQVSSIDESGKRNLPMSSSPEIYDDTEQAWFAETTNYDLAFIRWTLEKAAELADELGKADAAKYYRAQLAQWPELRLSDKSVLLIAPGLALPESHRHFAQLVPIYPLDMVSKENGAKDEAIIAASVKQHEDLGFYKWVGFSFPWDACIRTRQGDGEKALSSLHLFANHFCSSNSFNLNGDQSGRGYSEWTYRPFTLEGNFAFAAAVNEMLLQSHNSYIELFPATPEAWRDVSFNTLRAQGAFLVSAIKKDGRIHRLEIESLAGRKLRIKNPFMDVTNKLTVQGATLSSEEMQKEYLELKMEKGQVIVFLNN